MNVYKHIETEKAIKKLIDGFQIIISPGGYFGDEAKGKTVAGIGEDPRVTIFARVNSGENAGHTIYFKGEKYVFNLLPSGVFTGKKIIVGDNTVMDPLSFFSKEISPLLDRNISTNNIFIGNTSLVFPWHKISDALRNPNASTGKGISQVHSDISRKRDVSLEALVNGRHDLFEKNLEFWWKEIDPQLSDEVVDKLIENNNFPFDVSQILGAKNNKERIELLVEMYDKKVKEFLVEHYADTNQIMLDELKKRNKIVLEAPQSFFLSNSVGTHHSSSTSAHTHSSGIFAASNLPSDYMNKVLTINVHKAPGSSRVGSGANPSGHVEQEWFNRRGLKRESLNYDIDLKSALKQFVESIDIETGLQNYNALYVDENG
ncbi:MAG: adenylosuccinate synthetase, partial [Nanoarchaeota archaeon]|nr:adenylosuccinate synthetase [Nanoarchaeota archaeon]